MKDTRLMSDLHLLFNPSSIAIVGASDKPASIGARTVENLLTHSKFAGDVYLVSTTKEEIAGRPCHRSVKELPATPDVAVIVVPASAVLDVVGQCADRGVKFAVVLTSGFSETGDEGRALEQEMVAIARRGGMRVYGPNCPGLCNVTGRLGLTFSPSFPHDLRPGPIGIATQGGGLGRNVMQAMERGIGVAAWSSSGNEADLQVADFIDYMAEAPDIKVIVALIEGFKDGRRFVDAARKAARMGKPIVALKVGRSEYGAKAAASHTASITGSAEVNSAAMRQLGVIEVDDIDELVDTAWLLARQMPGKAEDVAVYCSSGGAAALTADVIGQYGLGMASFTDATKAALRSQLPSFAAVENPVDTTAAVIANPELIDSTLLTVCRDPNVGIVVLPSSIDYGKVTVVTAQAAVRAQQHSPVPLLPIWMSDRLGDAFSVYADAGMVPARSVGKAVKAVRRWVDYGRWRRETHHMEWAPWPSLGQSVSDEPALAMSEVDAKAWLREHGLPVPANALARNRDEAMAHATQIGFPVVAKVASGDITHKTEVGGVRLNLQDADAVGKGWDAIMASVDAKAPCARIDGLLVEGMAAAGGVETFVGVSRDPVFGHVLTFGLGGIYVEIFKDVARRLLPLQPEEARAMVREIRSFALLDGARGRPKADLDALVGLLIAVSDFVGKHAGQIQELDLNPVWVGPAGQGVQVLDAVILRRAVAST